MFCVFIILQRWKIIYWLNYDSYYYIRCLDECSDPDLFSDKKVMTELCLIHSFGIP